MGGSATPRQLPFMSQAFARISRVTLTAVDLFAGAGGATQGLRDAGFDVVVGVEIESDAATTWAMNHPGLMLEADVRELSGEALMTAGGFGKGELDLLKACPPCQGFSTLRGNRTPDESRNDLVLDTLRLVDELRPRAVLIENVPGLRNDGRFKTLEAGMRKLGYALRDYIVEATDLGGTTAPPPTCGHRGARRR